MMLSTTSIITSSDEGRFTMQRIAITNQKGGVGKTTIAAHLATGLARNEHDVLAIDLDPKDISWATMDSERTFTEQKSTI